MVSFCIQISGEKEVNWILKSKSVLLSLWVSFAVCTQRKYEAGAFCRGPLIVHLGEGISTWMLFRELVLTWTRSGISSGPFFSLKEDVGSII